MTNTYPTDCPCGSRCDGHAIGAPEDPGLEWDGLGVHGEWCSACVCFCSPNGVRIGPPPREETRYSDRSPREEWVGAWKVKQETHR